MRANTLISRDPAMAALMGAATMAGAEFGNEDYEFSEDFEFAEDDDLFGDFDFAADKPGKMATVSKQEVMQAWKKEQNRNRRTQQRLSMLQPNRGSAVDVERYSFTISQAIVIGTSDDLVLSGQPDTKIRPQRVTMNAPTPFFAFIRDIKVANVSVIVGGGVEDAYNYSAQGVSQNLDMPLLSPANRASVSGDYTGFVPPGVVNGMNVHFTTSFKGAASIIA